MEATAELPVSCDFEAAETSRILEELLAGIDRQVRPSRAPRRRASGIPSQPAAAGKPEDQHIVFTLAGIDYAVPLAGVVEIGRTSNITLVPNVPEWVLGVANVRGDIVSMVDLATFFGLDRCDRTADSRLLVARSLSGEMATGLVVEKVKGIRFVSENHITAPPSTLENRLTPYMRGVAEIDGRLVVLLDLDRLLLSAEMRQVELV
jgi:purine-binding chemotaxis protein CheW